MHWEPLGVALRTRVLKLQWYAAAVEGPKVVKGARCKLCLQIRRIFSVEFAKFYVGLMAWSNVQDTFNIQACHHVLGIFMSHSIFVPSCCLQGSPLRIPLGWFFRHPWTLSAPAGFKTPEPKRASVVSSPRHTHVFWLFLLDRFRLRSFDCHCNKSARPPTLGSRSAVSEDAVEVSFLPQLSA